MIEYPQVGIPLLVVVLASYWFFSWRDSVAKSWTAGGGEALRSRMEAAGGAYEEARVRSQSQGRMRTALEQIRTLDPEFSIVLFEDFLYTLYAEVHTARGAGNLDLVSPYVSDAARARLAQLPGTDVKGIVVGALRYVEVGGFDSATTRVAVTVEFEANTTETVNGREQTYYVVERWKLSRSKKARSRPPKRARVLDCPNCGAPLDKVVGSRCTYCHEIVGTGSFDWVVSSVSEMTRQERPPALTGDTVESGTDLPTVVDPSAKQRLEELCQRDPAMSFSAFSERVALVFRELGTAWSAQKLISARAFLSDQLFDGFQYWISAYQRAGLRNVTEEARIEDIQLARVVSDAHYDSITVRIFATSLDYTLDEQDRVVSGSRKKQRRYSEYWTLIRGSAVRGTPKSDLACPSCGAPLDINMAGSCTHCRAEVTAGNFDWVLSRVEQDDSY